MRELLKAYLALDLRSGETDRWPDLIQDWRLTLRLELSGMSEEMCRLLLGEGGRRDA